MTPTSVAVVARTFGGSCSVAETLGEFRYEHSWHYTERFPTTCLFVEHANAERFQRFDLLVLSGFA